MFLDEELEQIHAQKDKNLMDKSMLILEALTSRMPSPEEVLTISSSDFCTTIKRIDNGWRLFCKRHPNEYNTNAWRNRVLKADIEGKLAKALGWEENNHGKSNL